MKWTVALQPVARAAMGSTRAEMGSTRAAMGSTRAAMGITRAAMGIALVIAVALLADSTRAAPAQSIDDRIRLLASQAGVTGDPLKDKELPSADSSIARLGKALFFHVGLSGDNGTACASCHHPLLGGGDRLALSIGFGAHKRNLVGPGRRVKPSQLNREAEIKVPRNAPTTYNVGLIRNVIFHDGRIERIDGGINTPRSAPNTPDNKALNSLVGTQALFPVTSIAEMAGDGYDFSAPFDAIYDEISNRLRFGDTQRSGGKTRASDARPWVIRFKDVYDDKSNSPQVVITYPRIARALAAYQESQVFVNSPWNRYINGDSNALSESAKRGALLFFADASPTGKSCASCHSGDTFSDEKFHTLATAQIGAGKNVVTRTSKTDDLGRYHSSLNHADRHRFRTPTLLNVTETGPWGHAGAYATLEAIVRHHLSPIESLQTYDASALHEQIDTTDQRANAKSAIASFNRDWPNGSWPFTDNTLDDAAVSDLVAFLGSLTDPCVTSPECLKPWLPADEDQTITPDTLIAVDADGNAL